MAEFASPEDADTFARFSEDVVLFNIDDPFKNKALLFSNNAQELHPDPFQAEDPFKSDPFKGADPFKGDPFQSDPFAEQQTASTGERPRKGCLLVLPVCMLCVCEGSPSHPPPSVDRVRASITQTLDPFESSDPFSSSSVSSKGSGIQSSTEACAVGTGFEGTSPHSIKLLGPFGTLDPFGSGSFNSAEGFADFSQMSKGQCPFLFVALGGTELDGAVETHFTLAQPERAPTGFTETLLKIATFPEATA
eukprot:bmy_18569T0